VYDSNDTSNNETTNGGLKHHHRHRRVVGFEYETNVYDYDGQTIMTRKCSIEADVVVVAAGVGAASKVVGGLTLLHQPAIIAIANPAASHSLCSSSSSLKLNHILMDTVHESHVLQCCDGTIVSGGV
jgi:glycine/D-amino acid oxidase-like deaminating enzyme